MKFHIGVLTHNAIVNLRFDLLQATIESLRIAFPDSSIVILDNGSTDGTGAWVEMQSDGYVYVAEDGNHTPGRGENMLIQRLLDRGPADLVVLSDDDMYWLPDAAECLANFWPEAPKDLMIVSGLLEPVWHWNTPREVIEAGGERVLVRDSAPNAAWTFPPDRWSEIGPLIDDFGQDYEACVRLRAKGLRVAQTDLAEHRGWGYSTHGNEANKDGKPLDRKRWGV